MSIMQCRKKEVAPKPILKLVWSELHWRHFSQPRHIDGGWMASPLHRYLISHWHSHGQSMHYSWIGKRHNRSRNLETISALARISIPTPTSCKPATTGGGLFNYIDQIWKKKQFKKYITNVNYPSSLALDFIQFICTISTAKIGSKFGLSFNSKLCFFCWGLYLWPTTIPLSYVFSPWKNVIE